MDNNLDELMDNNLDELMDNNLDEQIQQILFESMQNNVDKLIDDDLNKVLKKSLDELESRENLINTLLEKESLLEYQNNLQKKKNERYKYFESMLQNINRLKIYDKNLSNTFYIFELIINDYLECNIDNYMITYELYIQILTEIKQIRITESEMELITTIFLH